MAAAGEQHGQTQFIAGLDRLPVPKAASGMNHGCDAMASRQANGVIEGKESVTGQHCSLGFLSRRLQGNPR